MSDKTFIFLVMVLTIIWNVFLVAGAAYLITIEDWSVWTMLLAIILCKWVDNTDVK